MLWGLRIMRKLPGRKEASGVPNDRAAGDAGASLSPEQAEYTQGELRMRIRFLGAPVKWALSHTRNIELREEHAA